MHVLPECGGKWKVMFWSRREWGDNAPLPNPTPGRPSLDPHECIPRIWDPENPTAKPVPSEDPLLRGGPEAVNLFCSGHTFLPDGKLLAVGGHLDDLRGSHKVRTYNPFTKRWAAEAPMGPPGKGGRWYPTAVTLPDGSVLVASGADQERNTNTSLQVFRNGVWSSISAFNQIPLYPWLHVAPDGRVFLSGPSKERKTQLLDPKTGQWEVVGDTFVGKDREYGSSVMYDVGKVLITGGGRPPQDTAERIDLNQATPKWEPAGKMATGRRQHNATLLPDGTVIVTGGTSGDGPPHPFNDVTKPVKTAELWDPSQPEIWTPLAEETFPRLYHSTAVLLPDGRVLSAGGGEYRIDTVEGQPENDPMHSHRNAQIFSPPYLFKSTPEKPRPDITSAPDEVAYRSRI